MNIYDFSVKTAERTIDDGYFSIVMNTNPYTYLGNRALDLSHAAENGWLGEADLMLSATSWDTTQARMAGLIADLLGTRTDSDVPAILVAAE